MTNEQIAEMERLENLIPPRPWVVEGYGGVNIIDGRRDWYGLRRPGRPNVFPPRFTREELLYLAALRNAAPDLIAAAKRLRALERVAEAARRYLYAKHIAPLAQAAYALEDALAALEQGGGEEGES